MPDLTAARFTVIGARGFIGAPLVARLRATGHDVFAPRRGDAELFTRELGHVIYAAGVTANFRSRPLATAEAHVGLPAELLAGAQFASFLYLSSTRVYAGSADTREEEPLLVAPAHPDAAYDLTKLAGEALCHAAGRPNVRVVRLSNVVGPGLRSPNFLAALAAEARATGRIVLRSAADSVKDYVALDDVLDLLPRIATNGRATVYNVASGVQTAHLVVAGQIASALGAAVEVAPAAPRTAFPPIVIDRLRDEFAYTPRPLESALASLLADLPGGAAPC